MTQNDIEKILQDPSRKLQIIEEETQSLKYSPLVDSDKTPTFFNSLFQKQFEASKLPACEKVEIHVIIAE